MSYPFYKVMHLFGIFVLLGCLAATCMHALGGGRRADNPWRKFLAAGHGIAALLILTGGFGMLARMGVMHGQLPVWIYIKLGIWGAFAVAMALPYRGRRLAASVLVGAPVIAALAAWTAIYKPS